jgi:hypothetical protein
MKFASFYYFTLILFWLESFTTYLIVRGLSFRSNKKPLGSGARNNPKTGESAASFKNGFLLFHTGELILPEAKRTVNPVQPIDVRRHYLSKNLTSG